MSFCKNCGSLIVGKNKCECSKIASPILIKENYETSPVIYHTEKKEVVCTESRQLTFLNSGNYIMLPINKPPFDLQASSSQEISHWIKKTIDWFYDTRKSYRLTFDGLVEYAVSSIGNVYNPEGKQKLEKVKEIARSFIYKTHELNLDEMHQEYDY